MQVRICRLLFPLFFLSLLLAPPQLFAADDRQVELVVVKSDNLTNIGKKYLADWQKWPEIGRLNHLRNYDFIREGQRLIIPVRLLRGVPADGRVVFIKGDVTVQTAAGAKWQVLRPDDPVRQGYGIKTGPESALEIAFADGTAFYQGADTVIGLKASEQKGKTHLLRQLVLSLGRILMNVRRATGQESRVEIHTPSAVAVARGTDFRVALDAGQSTTSEVLQGIVEVEALGRTVQVNEGEGTRVNKGEPPVQPRRLLPPPVLPDLQALYRTMPLQIKLQSVTGAVAYRFLLAKDREGKDVIRDKVVSGTTLELTGLADGSYYLQARSIDELAIEGLSLPPRELAVRVNPLPPFLQEPPSGAALKTKRVAFQWMRVPDAARYELQIARNPDFSRAVGKLFAAADTAYTHVFDDYGSYYYRLRSLATDGYEGIWSDVTTFSLIPPPPAPSLEAPVLGDKELKIRWRSQGEKMSYRFQMAREESFQNLFLEQVVERPEVTLPRPKEPGLYYVRTATIDPDRYEGAFSLPQIFEVRRPVPAIPVLEPPVVEGDKLQLRWTAPEKKLRYRYQIAAEQGFEKPLLDGQTDQGEITLPAPGKSGGYYARVSASDPEGEASPFSPPRPFEVPNQWLLPGILGVMVLILLL